MRIGITRGSAMACVVVVVGVGLASVSTDAATATTTSATTTVTIDPGIRSEPFTGWGTSLAWAANVTGGWTTPDANDPSIDKREALAKLLFGDPATTTSLGLNVARYAIGGGDNPDNEFPMREGGAIPGYKPTASGPYDWSADANQRWWLAEAKKLVAQRQSNADSFITDVKTYSAPWWMTVSGTSTGSENGKTDNLRPGYEAAFASYLGEVVQHFATEWDIKFRTIDPLNEPSTDYWKKGRIEDGKQKYGTQEGMHVSPGAPQKKVLEAMRTELANRGLSTGLSGVDETNVRMSLSDLDALKTAGFDFRSLSQINYHSYPDPARKEDKATGQLADPGETAADRENLSQLSQGTYRKKLTMSEYTDGSYWTHNDPALMSPATQYACTIGTTMDETKPSEWVAWQALESKQESLPYGWGGSNWGLVEFDSGADGKAQDYNLTKKFQVMRQYTNFIPPGSLFLYDDGANPADCLVSSAQKVTTTAAYVPSTGSLVVVASNSRTDGDESVTFDLSKFGTVGAKAKAYRTSATEDRAAVADAPVSGATLSVTLPKESVTTFILPVTGGMDNLVQNPDFEAKPKSTSEIPGWKTESGDRSIANLDADYVEDRGPGGRAGVHWAADTHNVYTWQKTTLPNGTYTLSASVTSSGGLEGANMIARPVGGEARDVRIPATDTPTKISIPGIVVAKGEIEFGFYSWTAKEKSRWITFDDVTLRPDAASLPNVAAAVDARTVTLHTVPTGATGIEYRVAGGAWQAYSSPFTVPGSAATLVEYRPTSQGVSGKLASVTLPDTVATATALLPLGVEKTVVTGEQITSLGAKVVNAAGDPVAGASVIFTMTGGVFDGGATTATVLSNAAGIAVTPSATASTPGRVTTTAAFRGITTALPDVQVLAPAAAMRASVQVTPAVVAGKVVLNVTVTNTGAAASTLKIATKYGTKSFSTVPQNGTVSYGFNTFLASVPAGTVTVTATGAPGTAVTVSPYPTAP